MQGKEKELHRRTEGLTRGKGESEGAELQKTFQRQGWTREMMALGEDLGEDAVAEREKIEKNPGGKQPFPHGRSRRYVLLPQQGRGEIIPLGVKEGGGPASVLWRSEELRRNTEGFLGLHALSGKSVGGQASLGRKGKMGGGNLKEKQIIWGTGK